MNQDEITEEQADRIHDMVAQLLWAHPRGCEECQWKGLGTSCPEWHRLAEVKKRWLAYKVQLQMIRDGYA